MPGAGWVGGMTSLRTGNVAVVPPTDGGRHDIAVLDEPYSDTMGHAGAVVLHSDGTLEGGHDPRADGGAAGV